MINLKKSEFHLLYCTFVGFWLGEDEEDYYSDEICEDKQAGAYYAEKSLITQETKIPRNFSDHLFE